MSTNKHIDKICIAAVCLTLVITILFMLGEKLGIAVVHREEDENSSGIFTANDMNAEWDITSACEIVLNGDSAKISGNGAYFCENTLYIVYAGKYVISGTLDGSIHIEADGDDKIWLLFDGVDITSKTEPPIYIKQADKVFLTLKENSQNTLAFENEDEETEIDGCIFSRDDLTVNGKGNLTVTSSNLHGIVCNDSLVFCGGNISITAKVDGVHAHDAIKICDTTITVSAGDDGLHAGNDDETGMFYLESGNISITECYEGIEANDIIIAGGTVNITPSDDGINANGSSKTSLITVSGGNITVINKNSRDADGFDSNGSIRITGGNVFISVTGTGANNAIDYGSEKGGKCTISGGTVIACGSSQMAECPESDSTQGIIMQTVSANKNEVVSVLNADGKEIISREIPCSFTSVIISSPDIALGDTLTLKVGDTEIEVTASNERIGDSSAFGNRGGFNPGDRNGQGGFRDRLGQSPFENGDNDPPQKPEEYFPGGDMFGEQNGIPPEMPDGENLSEQQRPDGNNTGPSDRNMAPSFGGNQNQGGSKNIQRAKWDMDFVPRGDQTPDELSDASAKAQWGLVGLSVFVLAAGLMIVLKKKY